MSDNPPTTRDYSWLSIVLKRDPKHYEPDKDVYKFSNDRGFESSDKSDSGVYDGT